MKILFDLHVTQPNKGSTFHGGGECGKTIFKRLTEYLPLENTEVDAAYNPDAFIDDWIHELCEQKGIKRIAVKGMQDLEEVLLNDGYDVYFSSFMYHPFHNAEIYEKVHVIAILHGLRSVEMPFDVTMFRYGSSLKHYLRCVYRMLFREKYIKNQIACFKQLLETSRNATFITDSCHSKYSFIKSMPDVQIDNRILVLAPPTRVATAEPDDGILERYRLREKGYLLIISADRWIKNAYRAVCAVDELFSSHLKDDMECVVLGVRGKNIFDKVINQKRFHFIDYVSSEELDGFYKNARLFVFPTLNEGFGLPPIEAMKFGTPTVASAISSVPEVCGDNVLYFNPFDKEEMKIRILQALDNPPKEETLKNYYQKVMGKIAADLDVTVKLILGLYS